LIGLCHNHSFSVDTNRNRLYPDGTNGYDYVYPDQGVWYEWYVLGVRKAVCGDFRSALFYHIPFLEINDVQADFERVDPTAAQEAFREPSGTARENSGFWQTVKELGATTHMFFGHCHRNLVNYEWQGVRWIFGLKTGTSYYHDADRIGGTLITIGQDRNVEVLFIYEVGLEVSERVMGLAEAYTTTRRRRPKVLYERGICGENSSAKSNVLNRNGLRQLSGRKDGKTR
jgi:hypothetical protein